MYGTKQYGGQKHPSQGAGFYNPLQSPFNFQGSRGSHFGRQQAFNLQGSRGSFFGRQDPCNPCPPPCPPPCNPCPPCNLSSIFSCCPDPCSNSCDPCSRQRGFF